MVKSVIRDELAWVKWGKWL